MNAASRTITLSPESFERLSLLAAGREATIETLVDEAVALLVADDDDIQSAFDEGLREIEAGKFYTNEEVRAQIDALLSKRRAA